MNTHADKATESRHRSVAQNHIENKEEIETVLPMKSARHDTMAQLKLQSLVNSSPRIQKFKAMQDMAKNHPLASQVPTKDQSPFRSETGQLPVQRTLNEDLLAIQNDIANTNDVLLKKILSEAIATSKRPDVNASYGRSNQKSHAEPVGDHGAGRRFDVVIDERQYPDDEERRSIIVHELLHASADSKYQINAKYNEDALTSPLRGNNKKEEYEFAGKQFVFARTLAEQLGAEAELERSRLGDQIANHVIMRANRIAGSNTQEFDTVASELLYFLRMRGVDDTTKTFRKVRNMAEAAYNARNGDIPITEGYIEPDSFREFAVKSRCFLTTACVYVYGLPDDCEELTVLRGLRDGYMSRRREEEELVALYYKVSPTILRAIMKRVDRVQILRSLYGVIRRAVDEVKSDRPEKAVLIYKEMVQELQEKFAPNR